MMENLIHFQWDIWVVVVVIIFSVELPVGSKTNSILNSLQDVYALTISFELMSNFANRTHIFS